MADGSEGSIKQAVLQKLEDLQLAGVTHLPKPKAGKKPPREATSAPASAPAAGFPAASRPVTSAPACPSGPVAITAQDVVAQLEVLRCQVARCTRCEELARTRTQTVFGVGNPQARLCFMGEAPGADEDRQGEPFVGRAGQLLTRIIEACGFRRQDVYILNTLKCRPPENRTPLPEEVSNCSDYLQAQLDLIRPEFICCLGAVAAQALLQSTFSIGRLRGKFHDYQGIQVICTYHPAYLLRNPAAKKDVWEDMKLLLAKMGLEVPGAKPQ